MHTPAAAAWQIGPAMTQSGPGTLREVAHVLRFARV